MNREPRNGELSPESACPDCLRRGWLIGRLAPFIQRACDNRAGRRTPELLRLSNRDLLEVVAPGRVDELLSWTAGLTEAELRRSLIEAGCWACCRHHPSFPVGLTDGADAPVALIGRGNGLRLTELDMEETVTVVGARRASGYGLDIAGLLGRELTAAGLHVVSGLALGIDGAAHRGALERGPTVAVLGCGADQPYPVSHTRLYRQVLERGLIISEMPPGTGAWRWSFPARNRIMAALSGMTVVVEAAKRSGSLITAEMAGDAGRDVGAVPGPVTAGPSAGTNELIANGAALIRGSQDVLDRMIGVGVERLQLFGPETSAGAGAVLEAVERGCVTVDAVTDFTARPAGEVAADLTRLELQGYLRGTDLGTWARTTLEAPYPVVTDE